MVVEVKNKGSYGGEMIIVHGATESFWSGVKENGIVARHNKSEAWFMLEHISLVSDKRFAQMLIDLVEDLGNYEISFSVKHYKCPRKAIGGASRYINKKSLNHHI